MNIKYFEDTDTLLCQRIEGPEVHYERISSPKKVLAVF